MYFMVNVPAARWEMCIWQFWEIVRLIEAERYKVWHNRVFPLFLAVCSLLPQFAAFATNVMEFWLVSSTMGIALALSYLCDIWLIDRFGD